MAQVGDTITYTYSDGTSVSEDVSTIAQITVDYIDSAGGRSNDSSVSGGNGGRVENVVADVSNFDTLYIWVADLDGRYTSASAPSGVPPLDGYATGDGAGSSEISKLNTDHVNSKEEPFIAASGGGGGAGGSEDSGAKAARGGYSDYLGNAPPSGGEGGEEASDGYDGEGAVSGHGSSVPILDSGTTIKGGGSGDGTAGEIQISYSSGNTAPSFTSGSESPTDGATGVSLDPTLSIDVTDPDGDSMDVSFYDASDDSQIGSTQTGVASGGTASVTWSGRDFATGYSWYAVADDGSATTQSSTFTFTTGEGIPANVVVSDDTTEEELTISWDKVTLSGVVGYYVYRAQTSGSTPSDYTQIADITDETTSYTDTGLEDGEKYYYRVSSHD